MTMAACYDPFGPYCTASTKDLVKLASNFIDGLAEFDETAKFNSICICVTSTDLCFKLTKHKK